MSRTLSQQPITPAGCKRQQGLSLLELVVALVIFAAGAGVIVSGLPAIMATLSDDGSDVESYILEARGCAEELLARQGELDLNDCNNSEPVTSFEDWISDFEREDILCDHQKLQFRCTLEDNGNGNGGWWVEILDDRGSTEHSIVLWVDDD